MRISAFVFFPALVLGSFVTSAQDITEAYNLSNQTVQGTARSMGFGNALGSVGGDFSSLSVNPAGLGIYRSSELSFTPSLRINSAKSEYGGSLNSDNNTRFNINQFAIVLTNAPKGKRYDQRNWKTVSFAFGMNRVADFNRNYTYSGYNNRSSASQVYESDANLYPLDVHSPDPTNVPGYMGYQGYLLNPDTMAGPDYYRSIVPFSGGINQLKSVRERGRINEYVLSLGGNYKEKLMLGVTVGFPSFRYERTSYYSETVAQGNKNNPNNFTSFSYGTSINIAGNGVNVKLGGIYKFSDIFRMGLAFHTPTYYTITDIFDPTLTSQAQGYSTVLTTSDFLLRQQFDYTVTTPWKSVVSATVMIKKLGFITADIEYVDYSATRFHYPSGIDYGTLISFQEEADAMNSLIKKSYKGVVNFRVGAEGRVRKDFMVRAGFGYYGDPNTTYGKETAPAAYTTQRMDLSCGLGFRFNKYFFADLGFVHSMYQGFEQPYNVAYTDGNGNALVLSGAPATVPTAKMDYSLNNLAVTIGLKF